MRFAVLVLFAIFLTAAPVLADASKVAPAVFTVKNGTVTVSAGQTFLIALDANPTTGFNWSALPSFERAVIAVDGSAYRGPAQALPGAGGVQIFVVRALAAGTTKLELGYARPFEKGVPPVKRADFSISVR